MPKEEQGLLRRLVARLTPQFIEDWRGEAGKNFRTGMTRISDYMEIKEHAPELPGLGWKALEGVASEKHAKAEADYAKAENDRIEAELKRRNMEANTRRACAEADKSEFDAELTQLKVYQARLELIEKANQIGVRINFDGRTISVTQGTPPKQLPIAAIKEQEIAAVKTVLTDVVFTPDQPETDKFTMGSWIYKISEEVVESLPLC
jgi:hypothetical protein